jgi:general secretion pathway protein E
MTTGPTGSGKTTTLYTALNLLNSEDRNIVTIEDPVEYQLAGVIQVGVDLKTNLTFANGLRSILRQDPDVIMLGEIRDSETAQVAVRAALTGHLVFTTMHTNTSAGAMVTLMNMGVPHFLVSSAVIGIIAQRLVRRICLDCKQPQRPTKNLLADLGLRPNARPKIFAGEGCGNCWETGYKGRAGVYEVLLVDREIRALADEEVAEAALLKQAVKAGMMTLQEAGLSKMRQGITSAEEILKTVFMND